MLPGFLREPEAEETPGQAVNVERIVNKQTTTLLHGDCRKYLFDFVEEDSIDLTVTSPPYDNLRTYNNSSTWGWPEFSAVAAGLWRVTKHGGVVVWVGDATIKGSETGSIFEQALAFKKMGFNLHDTMIFRKHPPPNNSKRYEQHHEYMFVLSKGDISVFNPIMVPSTFPENLAHDHIISWSNKGDTVFDPFMGSGTTGKMAKQLGRNFIGCEIDEEYFKIAQERIWSC
jgi:DNA modification methylase